MLPRAVILHTFVTTSVRRSLRSSEAKRRRNGMHDVRQQNALVISQALDHPPRIRGLDGLRALAALGIFLWHAWIQAGHPQAEFDVGTWGSVRLESLALLGGYVGVALFFVLSGFLLSQVFWRELLGGSPVRLGEYVRRRFLRIYPAYFAVVLIMTLVDLIYPPIHFNVVNTVSHLLLLHNLTEGTIYGISGPLWYVATASQLYAGLPLIFLVLKRLWKQGMAPVYLLLGLFIMSGAVGVLVYVTANLVLARIPVDPTLIAIEGRVLLHSPITNLAPFCAGIAIGYLHMVHSLPIAAREYCPRRWEFALYLTTLVAPSLSLLTLRLCGRWSPVGWPVIPLLMAALVFGVSRSTRPWGLATVLEFAPLRFLGKISYSFFLWHSYVIAVVWDRLLPGYGVIARAVCAIMITGAVACLSYQVLELRFAAVVTQVWGRARARRQAARAATGESGHVSTMP